MKKIKKIVKKMIGFSKQEKLVPIPHLVNYPNLLEGKVALITGGTGGIGIAIAKAFLQSNCKVILAGTNEEKLVQFCAELSEWQENLKWIVIDVLSVDTIQQKVSQAARLFPENKIDILVNSAGIATDEVFGNITEKNYDNVMNINVKGTLFMGQAVGNYMIENKIKGHILNVSSSSALRPATSAYQLSKWAIRGLTMGMADELLPYGIVVNAIAPGRTATPMLKRKEGDTLYHPKCPAGRYIMPEEVAALALFMVSDFGNMIIGDSFYITGGSGTISMHR